MNGEETTLWLPSAKLRQWMLVGAGAVFVDACVCTASFTIDMLRNAEPEGPSLTDALDSSIIIPEILVVLALLALAREAGSLGLWRSSIGVFGCMWSFAPLTYMSDDAWQWWDIALGLTMVIGVGCVFLVVSRRPQAFLISNSTSGPNDRAADGKDLESVGSSSESPGNENAGGWGCGAAFGAAVIARLIMRGLRKFNIDWLAMGVMIACGVLICSVAVFTFWFGVSKIQLRRKLGGIAVAVGAIDILAVVLYLSVLAYLLVILAPMAMNGQEPDFRAPALHIPSMAASMVDIVWRISIGVLFISVWNRVEDPWEAEIRRASP